MTINSTQSKRTVGLDIQTIDTNQPEPNCGRSHGTEIIVAIGVFVNDGMEVTEDSFTDASEIDMLRRFWRLVRPHDVFVGHGIANQLAFLRRRSWELGLIPSREIGLRAIYQHQMLDPASLQAITGGIEDGCAEALLWMFGLPLKTSANKTTTEFQVAAYATETNASSEGLEVDYAVREQRAAICRRTALHPGVVPLKTLGTRVEEAADCILRDL
jgi:hypothetical protein